MTGPSTVRQDRDHWRTEAADWKAQAQRLKSGTMLLAVTRAGSDRILRYKNRPRPRRASPPTNRKTKIPPAPPRVFSSYRFFARVLRSRGGRVGPSGRGVHPRPTRALRPPAARQQAHDRRARHRATADRSSRRKKTAAVLGAATPDVTKPVTKHPGGRPALGDKPMSSAERTRRHRTKQAAGAAPENHDRPA